MTSLVHICTNTTTTKSTNIAVVDTGASCFAFNSLLNFETLDMNKGGQVEIFDSKSNYDGTGRANFQLENCKRIFRFPAFYAPKSKVNVLSHADLLGAGVTLLHSKQNPRLLFPPEDQVAMQMSTGVSIVNVVPPNPVALMSLEIKASLATFWNERFLHSSKDKLVKMGLIDHADNLQPCSICRAHKPKYK